MGYEYDDEESFTDEQIEFYYEGLSFTWDGDYTVRTWGELDSYDSPGISEREVSIDYTNALVFYDEESGQFIDAEITPELIKIIESELESTL
jgi:hypothetical protein